MIRVDGAGATHELLGWIVGQRMSSSVGFALPESILAELAKIPKKMWQPAYDRDGEPRDGAWVLEVTGLLHLPCWPEGMRVIVRKERPHPGAQLRITDADGHRLTTFATNTTPGCVWSPEPAPAEPQFFTNHRARCTRDLPGSAGAPDVRDEPARGQRQRARPAHHAACPVGHRPAYRSA